jgi:hypothetical protein
MGYTIPTDRERERERDGAEEEEEDEIVKMKEGREERGI